MIKLSPCIVESQVICTPKAVMVGDDVLNDVGGAQGCGIMGILVRTGKYRCVH